MIAAVIFDFDGIVLDSETPEYESHRRIYERCGATLTVDEWCGVIGTWSEGHDERWISTLAARSADAPSREDYHAERRRIFESIVPRKPMRGIRELTAGLMAAGVPAAMRRATRPVASEAYRLTPHALSIRASAFGKPASA